MKKYKLIKIALAVLIFAIPIGAFVWQFLSYADTRNWEERRKSVATLAGEGNVLVDAIQRYHEATRKYPVTLQELVPNYIDELPQIERNDINHGKYEYSLAHDDDMYEGYELYFLTPRWFVNFDTLFYWPSETYPDSIHGQKVESIGKWAYLHE